MRIAIVGGGAVGVCACLELAARGCSVDLYDENPIPVSRASHNNEGKIHLGILYAKDHSLRTASTMITGALHFVANLNRWIDVDPDVLDLSTPFYYAVHNDTMVPVDDLKGHYSRCRELFRDAQDATGHAYLGVDKDMAVEELPRAEQEAVVDGASFRTVFRTTERAVDPRPLAAMLREAVAAAAPDVRFIGGARVMGVSEVAGQLEVCFELDGEVHRERYDHVANTLWHGRLEIDASHGLKYDRAWLYRYKFGSRVFVRLPEASPPSITCVLGPFGDIVNFGDRGLYLSWYPTGMTATSQDLRPPEWDQELSVEVRHDVFRRSYEHWLKLCPALASVVFAAEDVDPSGGVIFAWGDTGIDDHDSELHTRYQIGIHSVGNYHTVDTGKFTMTPYFGLKTAERILGLS